LDIAIPREFEAYYQAQKQNEEQKNAGIRIERTLEQSDEN
jgi:hypothetical protein